MLDVQDTHIATAADAWLDRLNTALGKGAPLDDLFLADSHWRDLVALTGELRTTSGDVPGKLAAAWKHVGATAFQRHPTRMPPCKANRAGVEVFEAVFTFETSDGFGEGLVRLKAEDPTRAWTIMTSLDRLHGQEGRVPRTGPISGRPRGPMPTATRRYWSSAVGMLG